MKATREDIDEIYGILGEVPGYDEINSAVTRSWKCPECGEQGYVKRAHHVHGVRARNMVGLAGGRNDGFHAAILLAPQARAEESWSGARAARYSLPLLVLTVGTIAPPEMNTSPFFPATPLSLTRPNA